MNPLDISSLDTSTLNLSLNMSTTGKKGSTEGTPLPVMLQPTSTVSVSSSPSFLEFQSPFLRFLTPVTKTTTKPPRRMFKFCGRAATALDKNMILRAPLGPTSKRMPLYGPNTPIGSIVRKKKKKLLKRYCE